MKIKQELKIITQGKLDVFALSNAEKDLFFNSLLTNFLEIYNKNKGGTKWKQL